ncbi:MAG TPA: ABC transporter permease [Candidatus Dormibacteraeota bacterium]|nr:ABC transporter permease [Candidatus Dormibacteraeota bacterium]
MTAWARRLRRLVRNPLIVKDGLSRMRSWRAPAVMALYLGMLGLFAWLVLALQLQTTQRLWGLAQVGKAVFTALAVVQLALVCLFGPGVAAGAISGERERQTLDVLLVSCMTSFAIAWGKLVASVAFVILLVVVGLPVFATVFLFGGVDLQQFLVVQLVTVTTALAIGAVSLFLSTVTGRTLVSTVFAYGLTFAGTAGSGVVGVVLTALLATRQPRSGPTLEQYPLLLFNPVTAILEVLQNPSVPPMRLGRALQLAVLDGGPASSWGPALEAWQATMTAELVLALLGVLGTVWLLRGWRRPSFRWRPAGQGEPAPGPEPLAERGGAA